jgi:hypothetical protein
MGMLSRMLFPRKVRRVAHPGRAVKRAVMPRSVKKVRHDLHPVSNAKYSAERSLNTKRRTASRTTVYHHGTCPVNHRSPEAVAKCHRTH